MVGQATPVTASGRPRLTNPIYARAISSGPGRERAGGVASVSWLSGTFISFPGLAGLIMGYGNDSRQNGPFVPEHVTRHSLVRHRFRSPRRTKTEPIRISPTRLRTGVGVRNRVATPTSICLRRDQARDRNIAGNAGKTGLVSN